MTDRGVGSWPARRARMSPAKLALRDADRELTYAELADRVDQVAEGLGRRGVGRGDRVAYLGLNSIALVEVLFAAARVGAVFVPLNTRLAPPEAAYVLRDADPALLLVDDGFDGTLDHPDVQATGVPVVRVSAEGREPLHEVVAPSGPRGSSGETEVDVGLDDLLMIQYTSGTSGRPKGVCLSHGNITWNAYNLLVDVDLGQDEISLVTAPLFHTAALNQVLLPTVLKGGTSLIEARFDAGRVLELVEDQGVTLLFGVTSMYLALSQHPRFASADLHTLRSALGGGSPFPRSLLETWAARGLALIQGYGLTETSPGATMLRAPDAMRKLGSAGTACFFTEVAVVDADGGRVEPGGTGEVLVSGPNVSAGYWRNEGATAEAITDGWLHTGDVAHLDDDGFVFIVDRLKDMYISGGENVYPAEVEQALYAHPAVAECAVIGVPDERWGETGRAVVVRDAGAACTVDELLEHARTRLARYKVPASVVFVSSLPHTASGKLRRGDVRRELVPDPPLDPDDQEPR